MQVVPIHSTPSGEIEEIAINLTVEEAVMLWHVINVGPGMSLNKYAERLSSSSFHLSRFNDTLFNKLDAIRTINTLGRTNKLPLLSSTNRTLKKQTTVKETKPVVTRKIYVRRTNEEA